MDSNHRSSGCRPDVFATGPRDHEVAEIGVEPTKSPASRAGRFSRLRTRLCLAADMTASGRSRGRTWQAKGMSLHWALAHLRRYCVHSKLQAPESNRATGLMRASWAPAAPAVNKTSDQGESRTPKPEWARRSERRVSTSCTTWPKHFGFRIWDFGFNRADAGSLVPDRNWIQENPKSEIPYPK
jgi:hypothetical protein